MATIRAAYKRTFQTRPYETSVVELSIEDEMAPEDESFTVARAASMYRALAEVGDALMAEALTKPDPAGRK